MVNQGLYEELLHTTWAEEHTPTEPTSGKELVNKDSRRLSVTPVYTWNGEVLSGI